MSEMTPREIVSETNKHIIGQDNAKRSAAIALRNRWRRMQLNEELRHEVTPKNILMIGPTGVGNRNRPSSGKTGQRAVHQSRSNKIHRSRLCW